MNAPGPGWHRLHPLSPAVGAGRAVVTVAVIFAPSILGGGRDTWGSAGHLGVLGVLVLLGFVSWLVTRWRIEGDALQIETGLLRRRSLRYPLVQIQAVDTVRPGIARLFGLAELRLRMAGTGGAARLAYLPAGQADAVRAQLLAARRVEAAEGPLQAEYEEVLVRVPTGRVAGSVVLSWPVIVMSIEVVVLVVSVLYNLTVVRTIAGSTAVFFIGAATTLWRGFNRSYRLTVADAHDGLRVSSGLVETTAETIPRGRVQAVQITQPALWRPLGWCRLEVDIAGRVGGRGHGDERGARRQLRAVLPVGTLVEARLLLERIAPGAPEPCRRPPRRARWKSPLRYRRLAFGLDETYAVATTGRLLAQSTAWVPLTKVQSLRRVQGPVQRAFGLATVHLDTAGKNVGSAFRDLDASEAEAELMRLVDLARDARRASIL